MSEPAWINSRLVKTDQPKFRYSDDLALNSVLSPPIIEGAESGVWVEVDSVELGEA